VSNSPRSSRSILLLWGAAVIFSARASAASWDLSQLNVPTRDPVILKFKATDPTRAPIDEQWLLASLTEALQAKSRWPLRSDNEAIADLKGLRTRLDQSRAEILFQYVHVDHNRESVEWGQMLTLPVSYQVERGGDSITIHLLSPATAEFASRRNPVLVFIPAPKLWASGPVLADFANIMATAQSLKLSHTVHVAGRGDVVLQTGVVCREFRAPARPIPIWERRTRRCLFISCGPGAGAVEDSRVSLSRWCQAAL
jgi:hypothetical protein